MTRGAESRGEVGMCENAIEGGGECRDVARGGEEPAPTVDHEVRQPPGCECDDRRSACLCLGGDETEPLPDRRDDQR